MADTIQIRRGTTSAWNAANPVLALGEQGYDTTTKQYKVGDGTTAWTALAYSTPGHIAANTVLANPTGVLANPVGVNAAGMRTLIEYQDYCPIINMDDYGVHPGNSAATNQTAIANLIARIKNSSTINRFHLRLNRAGTFNIQKGSSGDFLTRFAAILLPSNCTLELSKDSVFRMTLEELAWIVRNDDPINGNRNIRIIGGQYDGNSFDGVQEVSVIPGQGYYGQLFWFENITDLHVEQVVCRNPNHWAIAGTKLTRATFQSLYMDDVPRDGIHLVGECYDVNIFDYEGEKHDNGIAIATAENPAQNAGQYAFGNFNWANGTFAHGDMKRIRIERVNIVNSNGPIVLFGRRDDTLQDIYIADVNGETSLTSAYAICLNQYQLGNGSTDPEISINPTVRNLVIERVRVTTKASEPAVYISGNKTRDVTIRDVTANGIGVVLVGNGYESVKLDNIRASGNDNCIEFGSATSSLDFYSRAVDIGNVSYFPSSGSKSAIRVDSNANWDSFYVDNLVCSATGVSYRGISVAGTTRRRISIGTATFGLGGETCVQGNGDFDVASLKTRAQDYIATDGARLSIVKWPQHLLTASKGAITSDASVTADYQIMVVEVLWSQLTSGGDVFLLTTANGLPLLPRGAIICAAAIKSQAAFVGPGITALRVRLANNTPITPEFYVTTPDNAALVWNEITPYSSQINTAVDWQILALGYSGQLNTLTAGRAKVFLKYFVAQA